MAFSEATKLQVRRNSHFCCCLCKSAGIEIHHILAQTEGGLDTEDNAAPLCPSCHEMYGANPTKRKYIREARNHWYEICAMRYSGDPNSLEEIRAKLGKVATKEDVERIVLKNLSRIQGQSNEFPWQHLKYSFEREEFVHPLIVQELLGWMSDSGQPITAVDIGLANNSNRFYGEFSAEKINGRTLVKYRDSKRGSFSYSFVGVSPSGIQIVQCHDWGGGSGVFKYICFFCFEQDRCLNYNSSQPLAVRNRVVLKVLGSIGLGDRYDGVIQYNEGKLIVGPDIGWFSRGNDACMELQVE
jgi:hypothetical protein